MLFYVNIKYLLIDKSNVRFDIYHSEQNIHKHNLIYNLNLYKLNMHLYENNKYVSSYYYFNIYFIVYLIIISDLFCNYLTMKRYQYKKVILSFINSYNYMKISIYIILDFNYIILKNISISIMIFFITI